MAQKSKTVWVRWAVIGTLAIAAAIAVGMQRRGPETVPAFTVKRNSVLQTVVATGKVVPPATIEVGSMRLGKVVSVAVDEGQKVKAGDLLLHLDDTEPLAAAAESEARLREARLKLDNLRKLSSPSAKAELERASLAVAQKEDDFARAQTLFAGGVSNSAELSAAKNALETARQNREKAALEEANLGARGNAFQMALASLAQAEAALDQNRARLAYSHVHTPVDGVILKKKVDPGTVVQPGQMLFVIAQTGETTIEVPIDEKNLKGLNEGDTARVSADAFPDEHFSAVVTKLAPAVDPERGTLDVKLTAPSPPDYLRTEMTVSVEIQIAEQHKAMVFPAEALYSGVDGESFVWLDQGGTAQRRAVKTGLRGDILYEAKEGLKEGDIVLLPGANKLNPGDKVRSLIRSLQPQ